MSRGSNLGRTAFAVAAAAGAAGLLSYTPPQTDLRAAGPTPERARPIVTGPLTATPGPMHVPADEAPGTTVTTAAPVTAAPPAAPPATDPPPPPPTEVAPEPVPAPPAATYFAPTYTYSDPEPVPEPEPEATPDDSGDNCANFGSLLTILDDPELRTAISTVGC